MLDKSIEKLKSETSKRLARIELERINLETAIAAMTKRLNRYIKESKDLELRLVELDKIYENSN